MELETTTIRNDTHSKIATVFPLSARGTLSTGQYWSKPLKVQRFVNLFCELIASVIPNNTTISIQTSRYLHAPTSDADWFTQDSYTWDSSCSSFKYLDPYGEARWFRVKIEVTSGEVKNLAWCLGGNKI